MAVEDIIRHIDYVETPAESELSRAFGHAMRLLSFAGKRREQTLKSIAGTLWPAVQLRQIELLFNSHGQAVAFATWAWLSPELGDLMRREPGYTLHLSEWNEGDQFWIVDFFAPFGDARNLCRRLRNRHAARGGRVRAIRHYANGKNPRLVDVGTVRQTQAARLTSFRP
jgi:cytolysin-activating lysine-acyltransferase